MRGHAGQSTRFVTARNAHRVGLRVTVTGEHPRERPPTDVNLIPHRSGSMPGEPPRAAREAALRRACRARDMGVDRKYHVARATAEDNLRMDCKQRIARRTPGRARRSGDRPDPS